MTIAHSTAFAGWPPAGTVFKVEAVDLTVLSGEHPYHVRERQAAAANWQREIAANPALFDGQMVFFKEVSLTGGVIRGTAHMIPFSTHLWWRKQAAVTGGFHLFGSAVPVSSDGAIIAIRMGEHTANPGKVYCAAGSLDRSDVVNGKCDLEGNMAREVREETGLDLAEARPDPVLYATHDRRRFSIFRFFRFALTAEEMLERIAAHMLTDEEKEIDGAVAIRSADASAQPYGALMPPVLDLFFNSQISSKHDLPGRAQS